MEQETLLPQSAPQSEGINERILEVTERAVQQIETLLLNESKGFFRVSVKGGGCSGFQYHFCMDTQVTPDDVSFQQGLVMIDEMSLQLLNGAQLDYVEDLMGATFVIQNPNAKSGCGCGSSFSLI